MRLHASPCRSWEPTGLCSCGDSLGKRDAAGVGTQGHTHFTQSDRCTCTQSSGQGSINHALHHCLASKATFFQGTEQPDDIGSGFPRDQMSLFTSWQTIYYCLSCMYFQTGWYEKRDVANYFYLCLVLFLTRPLWRQSPLEDTNSAANAVVLYSPTSRHSFSF